MLSKLSSLISRRLANTKHFTSSSVKFNDRDWSSAPPLVIRNGTVVNHDGMFKADVVTKEGKIIKVGHLTADDIPSNAREIDATNRYVMPGGIDTHTHLEMPFMGTTTIDDYHYGTTAAVAGGTTLLMDFVIPGKDGGLVNAYKEWEGRAAPKINCDIAFHLAVTYYSEEMLEEMATITNDYGVTSYKFFMAYNRVLRMYDDELLNVFKRCNEIGALAQVHAGKESGEAALEATGDVCGTEAGKHYDELSPILRVTMAQARCRSQANQTQARNSREKGYCHHAQNSSIGAS